MGDHWDGGGCHGGQALVVAVAAGDAPEQGEHAPDSGVRLATPDQVCAIGPRAAGASLNQIITQHASTEMRTATQPGAGWPWGLLGVQ